MLLINDILWNLCWWVWIWWQWNMYWVIGATTTLISRGEFSLVDDRGDSAGRAPVGNRYVENNLGLYCLLRKPPRTLFEEDIRMHPSIDILWYFWWFLLIMKIIKNFECYWLIYFCSCLTTTKCPFLASPSRYWAFSSPHSPFFPTELSLMDSTIFLLSVSTVRLHLGFSSFFHLVHSNLNFFSTFEWCSFSIWSSLFPIFPSSQLKVYS